MVYTRLSPILPDRIKVLNAVKYYALRRAECNFTGENSRPYEYHGTDAYDRPFGYHVSLGGEHPAYFYWRDTTVLFALRNLHAVLMRFAADYRKRGDYKGAARYVQQARDTRLQLAKSIRRLH